LSVAGVFGLVRFFFLFIYTT